ncbi:reverse transcriptase domain-containing protein [Tanacetum coccineum]
MYGKPSKDKSCREDNKRLETGMLLLLLYNTEGKRRMRVLVAQVKPSGNSYHAPRSAMSHMLQLSACPRIIVATRKRKKITNQVATNVTRVRVNGNQGNQLGGIEPNDLGFRYEIKIASRQLVEIDKVIKGCKLEIEDYVFDIDLIPFGHGSFDVIIGMDWLSNYKAEIIFHEKVVRIPLPDGKVLRVLGEKPEEKARLLMSAKANEKKQEEIIVVRYFPKPKSPNRYGTFLNIDVDFIRQLKELQEQRFISTKHKRRHSRALKLCFGLGLLKKEKPYTNFSKLNSSLREVQFLRHVDKCNGNHLDTQFIDELSKIANSLLTSDSEVSARWSKRLCGILLGCVLMQIVKFATILSSIKDRILAAQKEAVDESLAGLQKGFGMNDRNRKVMN